MLRLGLVCNSLLFPLRINLMYTVLHKILTEAKFYGCGIRKYLMDSHAVVNTANGKTFGGLNFCGIYNQWIFAVILLRYNAEHLHTIYICLYLEQKIHRKNFHTSLKKPRKP